MVLFASGWRRRAEFREAYVGFEEEEEEDEEEEVVVVENVIHPFFCMISTPNPKTSALSPQSVG